MLDGFFHILNPNKRHRPLVEDYVRRHNDLDHIWVERDSHPTHVETIVDWALMENRTGLAVWSGDGTFSRVVQRLFASGRLPEFTLALIPVGTGNDFIRKVKPRPWDEFVGRLEKENAPPKQVDLGLVEFAGVRRIFVNNAGFGRAGDAMGRKRPNAIKDILAFTEKNLQLTWDAGGKKENSSLPALLGIVFNAPYFNSGMHFTTDAEPDDGLLNVFIEPPQSRWGLLLKFIFSRFGLPLKDKNTIERKTTSLEVKSDALLFPQSDGEPITKTGTKDIRFTVLPGVLKLQLPT